MRRPDRLTGTRTSLGRRVIEPESFISSSCVGDRYQNLNRHRITMRASGSPLDQGRLKARNAALLGTSHP
jgi:hypothetical protein